MRGHDARGGSLCRKEEETYAERVRMQPSIAGQFRPAPVAARKPKDVQIPMIGIAINSRPPTVPGASLRVWLQHHSRGDPEPH
jgi:hypothetical protein